MRLSFILLLLATLFAGCEKEINLTVFSGIAMTMPYRAVIAGRLDREREEMVKEIIGDVFGHINKIFNKWNPDSEISRLNRAKAGEKIALTPDMEQHLQEIDRLYRLTNGLFDPSIEPIWTLWQEGNDSFQDSASAVGWDKIHLQNRFFWKEDSLTALDLGGIAKGLAIDLVVERLNAAGFFDIYFEWGGEIKTSGKHPEGRPWQILIKGKNVLTPLENAAIATSGDYCQKRVIGVKTYAHIIDPRQKRPLEITPSSITSVTVKAKSCLLADAIATAAMLLPSEKEALDWLNEIKNECDSLEFWVFVAEKKPETIPMAKSELMGAE